VQIITVFSWTYKNYKSLLALATDDILIATQHKTCVDRHRSELDDMFDYTFKQGNVLKFLNIRIIQSIHGISIDQTEHIIKTIVNAYWKDTPRENIKNQSSPFPTDPKFERILFKAIPLVGDKLKQVEKQHGGSLNHWVGGLMHVQVVTRYDLAYACMRLSGYMSAPTLPAFQALHHTMQFLYHHQHEPIMYPRKPLKTKKLLDVTSNEVMQNSRQLRTLVFSKIIMMETSPVI